MVYTVVNNLAISGHIFLDNSNLNNLIYWTWSNALLAPIKVHNIITVTVGIILNDFVHNKCTLISEVTTKRQSNIVHALQSKQQKMSGNPRKYIRDIA